MAGRRGRPVARSRPVGTLLLDAGALIGAAAGDPGVRAYLRAVARLGGEVVVSTVTLAETLRGDSRDAPIHRLLAATVRLPVSERIGRVAGGLLGRTKLAATVDALVAATAADLEGPVRLLTTDPDDLGALTEGMPNVRVVRV